MSVKKSHIGVRPYERLKKVSDDPWDFGKTLTKALPFTSNRPFFCVANPFGKAGFWLEALVNVKITHKSRVKIERILVGQ